MHWRSASPTSVHCIDWLSQAILKLSFQYPGRLPDLSGSHRLLLLSDYTSSPYQHYYSFVLTNEKELQKFSREIENWRTRYRIGTRRFEYKKFSDRIKLRLLPQFLKMMDQVPAVSLTIAIERKIKSLISGPNIERTAYPAIENVPDSIADSLVEKVFRSAAFASVLVNGLAKSGQDLVWISDDDDMFADHRVREGVRPIIEEVFNLTTSAQMGTLDLALASTFERHAAINDLLSVSDLCCGYFSTHHDKARGLISPIPKRRDAILSAWLARHGRPLRKLVFAYEQNVEGGPTLHRQVLSRPIGGTSWDAGSIVPPF